MNCWCEKSCSMSKPLSGNWFVFKGGNFVKIDFVPFLKGAYSKREEFAPNKSKFFSFRVDLF